MPNVRLKGLHRVRVKLASGKVAEYWYAWRGGPRLRGEPGTPAFMAAYNAAVAQRKAPVAGTMFSVMGVYRQSDEFKRLAPRTQADYRKHLAAIEARWGDVPVAALDDKRMRGKFKAWRDELAVKSKRQADYAWTILARVLSVALDRGLVPANPCERGGRIYRADRAEKVWTADDEAAFLGAAPAHLHLALTLALWTGQRQGDLLKLQWSDYDGARIRLRQGKTGRRLVIPVGAPLKAALDATKKRSLFVLTTMEGEPWSEGGFRASWRKGCAKAGVAGLTFHDFRGSAVTRLAIAGCTEAEIASLTGHSLRDVSAILDAHYLSRDVRLAESAIRKLESGTAHVK
jgi:integrase